MSSISSTSTLASWDPMELFALMNPDKLAITCVGYAPSCGRRCRDQIAFHNIQAAKAVMKRLVRPGVSDRELKEMLFDLAEYTLCRRYHQLQATEVSERWFGLVQRNRGDEEEGRFSDTSEDDDDDSDSDDGASSSSSEGSDNDDDAPPQRATVNTQAELRRRFAELETLQREFDGLLQTQRQRIRSRVPTSSLATQTRQPQTNSQHSSEATRRSNNNALCQRRRKEEEALRAAEQVRQEEAYRAVQQERAAAREQLRRERAEQARREEEARRQREAQLKREAEAERLRKERVEKARLEHERKAKEQAQKQKQRQKEQQQSSVLSWESAWNRYEAAWSNVNITHANANDASKSDIRDCQIWPTKRGTFASCCEEDIRAFFRCQPGEGGRRMLRRQALRWHPDRAARLFACVVDQVVAGELMKVATMISQVLIGVMGLLAL
jgi:hypothetical protein